MQGSVSLKASIDEPWFSFDAPAIVFASGRADRSMIDVLLDAGADVNARSDWWAGGVSALHQLTGTMLRFDRVLAEYLISRGATIDPHSAAGLGRLDALEEILNADSATVDELGPDGMTPLHYAANPEVADFLLERSADIDVQDRDHHGTPAQWALSGRKEVGRFLVGRGAEADLFLLVALGDGDRVERALQADPDLINTRSAGEAPGGHVYLYTNVGVGTTALHVAAAHDQVDIVKLLLDRGADPSARDPEHDGTPLQWAMHFDAKTTIDLLEQLEA